MERPLILVSNDDGIDAKGVRELVGFLEGLGDVICVCPDGPRSGQSMAITVNEPLRIRRHEDWHGAAMYSVNGTPVDCVKLSMHTIVPRRPDLMVSGINHGSNASVNVNYSGTMGAVLEACSCGIPSVGFSLTDYNPDADFGCVLPVVKRLLPRVLAGGLPAGVCLNVNVPVDCAPGAVRVVKAARGTWVNEYQDYRDPFGRRFYWLTGKFVNLSPDDVDTDEWCLAHGTASVVPCSLDRTTNDAMDFGWLLQ